MARGCGTQSYDAGYMLWKLGYRGIPVRHTTICPVWKLDPVKLGINDQGITKLPQLNYKGEHVEIDGMPIYDFYDVVGAKHYPYKVDFYSEACGKGISRRFPTNTNFDGIHREYSRYYLCHHKGVLSIDHAEFVRNELNRLRWSVYEPACFKEYNHHRLPLDDRFFETCTSMWHYEIPYTEFGDKDDFSRLVKDKILYFRSIDNVTFRALPITDTPFDFEFGAFMALQMGMLVGTLPKGKTELSKNVANTVKGAQDIGLPTATWDLETQGGF